MDTNTNTNTSTEADPGGRGRTGRVLWRALGSALAVLTIACGTLGAVGAIAHRSDTESQTYQRPVSRVVVDLEIGSVTIGRGDQDTVTVNRRLAWSVVKPRTEETWDGQTLRIQPDCGIVALGDVCRVDYTLLVPSGVEVEATTTTGDIAVNDLDGQLTLSTGGGDVTLVNTGGSTVAHTSTGRIAGTGLTSPDVVAEAEDGDVDLTWAEAPSAVAVSVGLGDVVVVVPGGEPYLVQASSGVGEVAIGVVQDPLSARTITAETVDGGVAVQYP